MNRPSCYGTTAKRSPYYRNHQCMNCLYILDCIEKEKMLEQTKANPTCFGTLPAPLSDLRQDRMCGICPHIKQCYAETHKTVGSTSYSDHPLAVSKGPVPPGTKLDNDKLRWSLLPLGTIAQVLKVLEFGATKYSPNNWMSVDNPQDRYYDAAMRHIEQWRNNEMNDNESGLHHLAHAICCLLFLTWFDGKKHDA